jgi:hypothetical protein
MSDEYPKVPATPENCEKDYQDKMKLNAEFEEFMKVFKDLAKISPEVQKLSVPVAKLEKALRLAAFGRHLVASEYEKNRRS